MSRLRIHPPKQPAAPAHIFAVRSAAGRAGAAARWDGVERVQTVQVRAYAADAERIRQMPGTSAEAIHALLEGRRA